IGLVAAPDPDRARFVGAVIGEVDVITPTGHSTAGVKTDRDVARAGQAVLKGKGAHRRVRDPAGVGQEGLVTGRDVVNADRVLVQGLIAVSGVVAPGVSLQCLGTGASVRRASFVGIERLITRSNIVVRRGVMIKRTATGGSVKAAAGVEK